MHCWFIGRNRRAAVLGNVARFVTGNEAENQEENCSERQEEKQRTDHRWFTIITCTVGSVRWESFSARQYFIHWRGPHGQSTNHLQQACNKRSSWHPLYAWPPTTPYLTVIWIGAFILEGLLEFQSHPIFMSFRREAEAEEEGYGEAVSTLRDVSGATWWAGQRKSAPPTDN